MSYTVGFGQTYKCELCGAVVADQTAHDRFHSELGLRWTPRNRAEIEERLKKTGASLTDARAGADLVTCDNLEYGTPPIKSKGET